MVLLRKVLFLNLDGGRKGISKASEGKAQENRLRKQALLQSLKGMESQRLGKKETHSDMPRKSSPCA
jgi:hypothetical protein